MSKGTTARVEKVRFTLYVSEPCDALKKAILAHCQLHRHGLQDRLTRVVKRTFDAADLSLSKDG